MKNKLLEYNQIIEDYKYKIKQLNTELNEHKNDINDILTMKFKIRGIHVKVVKYSITENWIDLFPAPPDSGVDHLILTFEEFSKQVEFLTD